MHRRNKGGSYECLLGPEARSHTQTNAVGTFGPHGSVAVCCNELCTAGELKSALGEKLELKKTSLPLFGLFLGTLGFPTCVLRDSAVVLPDEKLCFQRWNVSPEEEAKLTRFDYEAVHLLYCETRFYVEHGKLLPTKEQRRQMANFSGPLFLIEWQYLDLARIIPGYGSYMAVGAVLRSDVFSNGVHLPEGTVVTCEVAFDRLWLRAKDKVVQWRWGLVKKWRNPNARQLEYEVLLDRQNTSILSWINIETRQAGFLCSATYSVCLKLTEEQKEEDRHVSLGHPRAATRAYDPLVNRHNRDSFRATASSSLDEH